MSIAKNWAVRTVLVGWVAGGALGGALLLGASAGNTAPGITTTTGP
jgi:hypothetical protein